MPSPSPVADGRDARSCALASRTWARTDRLAEQAVDAAGGRRQPVAQRWRPAVSPAPSALPRSVARRHRPPRRRWTPGRLHRRVPAQPPARRASGSPSDRAVPRHPPRGPRATRSSSGRSLSRMPFVPVIRYWETDGVHLQRGAQGRTSGRPPAHGLECSSAPVTVPRSRTRWASPSPTRSGTPHRRPSSRRSSRARHWASCVPRTWSRRCVPSASTGADLFGNDRVTRLGRWPLVAQVRDRRWGQWDQGQTWTMVAGGDSFTDRGAIRAGREPQEGCRLSRSTEAPRGSPATSSATPARALTGNSHPELHPVRAPRASSGRSSRMPTWRSPITSSRRPRNWSFHKQGTHFSGKPDLTRIFVTAASTGCRWPTTTSGTTARRVS